MSTFRVVADRGDNEIRGAAAGSFVAFSVAELRADDETACRDLVVLVFVLVVVPLAAAAVEAEATVRGFAVPVGRLIGALQ